MSQSAAAASTQPLTDRSEVRKEDIKRLKDVLNDIEEEAKSYEFREAVPWKELGLNDYPEVIKQPMDLKTCRSKLVKQKYKRYEDFFKDVQLIWDNCKTYNMQGSDIYKLAEDCEKISKKAVNKAREVLGIGRAGAKSAKSKSKKSDGKSKSAAAGEDVDMNGGEDVDDDKKSDGSEDQTDADDVAFEEKVAFTEKVRRLTNEGLTRLVRKVKECCPDALEDIDAEKLHIQVDKIEKKSFEVLLKLVDDNLVKSKSKK